VVIRSRLSRLDRLRLEDIRYSHYHLKVHIIIYMLLVVIDNFICLPLRNYNLLCLHRTIRYYNIWIDGKSWKSWKTELKYRYLPTKHNDSYRKLLQHMNVFIIVHYRQFFYKPMTHNMCNLAKCNFIVMYCITYSYGSQHILIG